MDPAVYSQSLSIFTGSIINARLQESLQEISTHTWGNALPVYNWSDRQIAVKLTVAVDLPPLGNAGNIDIRATEPVLIVFDLDDYPLKAPWVCPDRVDFPCAELGHMYVSHNERPCGFCLVRGSMDDWYANKRPKDLITRISNWLRDGATGDLNEDGDQYEPLRLIGYNGSFLYDYDKVYAVANNKETPLNGTNFALCMFESNGQAADTLKLRKIVNKDTLPDLIKECDLEQKKKPSDPTRMNFTLGYILWAEKDTAQDRYLVTLPRNWGELKAFCKDHQIDTELLEDSVLSELPPINKLVPIIVAIKRTKPLIGFSGNLEFVNFRMMLCDADITDKKINDDTVLNFSQHLQPLTAKKAREISGKVADFGNYTLLAGCGALGSKIAMHFARSGNLKILHSDPDYIAAHNLVRHIAMPEGIGINKAHYIRNAIIKIFPEEDTKLSIATHRKSQIILEGETLELFDTVLDFTASESFLNYLVDLQFPKQVSIFRGVITDNGNLGILFKEGENRNPRLDDLRASLYWQSQHDPEIAAWLRRDANGSEAAIDVKVGVGCNSETFKLADDVVSYHAAYFSNVLKNITSPERRSSEGNVYLQFINEEPPFGTGNKAITVPAFEILHAENDPSWQIRIAAGLPNELLLQMTHHYPYETGGLFAGVANYKTKTIHVLGLIDAPPDSRANEVCFYRGVKGLKGLVDQITDLSGNQIGYIGEWHSHPHGPDGVSIKDDQTMREFKDDFEELPAPLPVFVMIVTTSGLFPYVY